MDEANWLFGKKAEGIHTEGIAQVCWPGPSLGDGTNILWGPCKNRSKELFLLFKGMFTHKGLTHSTSLIMQKYQLESLWVQEAENPTQKSFKP